MMHFGKFVWLTVLVLTFVGCGPRAAPKTSLFEDEHAVAAHWPTSVADLADKLRTRLSLLEMRFDAETMNELLDLVSWTPEIAADTNLPEADWLPLHEAAESLLPRLRNATVPPNRVQRDQLVSLIELLERSVPKIPEQLPRLGNDA